VLGLQRVLKAKMKIILTNDFLLGHCKSFIFEALEDKNITELLPLH
jgi:hypothetical protein